MLDKWISISVDFVPVRLLDRSKIPENEILFFYIEVFPSYLIATDSSSKSAEKATCVGSLRL
jgi:hypothetical protein